MNAEGLLAQNERVADAPDAISRLRRFILDLAVRGKLARQDPKDEPASELLKRIEQEKGGTAYRGSSRGRRAGGRGRSEDFEFELPTGWELSTLGAVALKITDGAHKTPTYVTKGVRFISIKDFSGGRLDLSNTRFITEEEHRVLYKRCDPKRGDILIGRIGTLGRAVLVDTDDEFSLFVSVGLIRFSHANIVADFFRILLNSPVVEAEFDRIKIGGATHTNKLNLSDLQTVTLPLPPLAEQHRIVAKVDELMALCDRLEAARAAREATRDKLTAASLARLNAPDPETFQDDARFVLDVLPALTTRPHQIKQLRQTILNLAMSGKLVPQDPNDEPASELLKRIAAEKARLVKAGEIKKAEAVTDLSDSDHGIPTPQGWTITHLQSLCGSVTDGDHLPPPKAENGIPFLVIGNIRSQRIDFTGTRFVPPQYYEALDPIRRPKNGDLLYTLVGSYGIPVVVRDDQPFCVQRHIGILRPSKLIDVNFLGRAMESTPLFDQATACATGIAQKTVPLSGLRSLLIPLPPLAEQRRIVAKVDELMGLCDRLEASLAASEATRRRLLNALLAQAMEPVEGDLEQAA
jgi:type I restriction enzyme S subunit